MIKRLVIFTLLPLMITLSCDQGLPPEDVYDNPLDEDEVGYETPALTFYPLENDVTLGSSFTVGVYVLGVEDLGGSHVSMTYDQTRLSILSVSVGDLFADTDQAPIFIAEQDDGSLEIHTSFLGNDSTSVSGTGSLANVVFTSITSGTSGLTYGSDCEFVSANDESIEIKGFGEGVVNAQ